MSEEERKQTEYVVANEFSVRLLFAIARKYHISEAKVIEIFDKIKYWDIINNDRVCCVVAHDGIMYTVNRLEEEINGILTQNR